MDKIDFTNHLNSISESNVNSFDPDEVWKSAVEYLRMNISQRDFAIWFKDIYLCSLDNGVAEIVCPDSIKKDRILRDYIEILRNSLKQSTGQNFEISFSVEPKKEDIAKKDRYEFFDPKKDVLDLFSEKEKEKKDLDKALHSAQLNPKYLFDNFIIGTSNRLAVAVAEAVVDDLGNIYNPVFFYGNTGLGKTHLMQAIGNEVLKKDPSKKIVYISIEQFLNEMIESIRTKKMDEFRNKYRAVDLLIIDDIQFVETYPKTQEELFHTFNTLYQANKQIILASDRPPQEIRNIADRLRSRFQGGMVTEIQAPDFETRLAILRQLLEDKGTDIDQNILNLIAKNIENSVRELEGALTKVISLKSLGEELSLEDVARILQVDLASKRNKISPMKVLKVVSDVFDVTITEIKGSKRTAYIALARQVVMYILNNDLGIPLEKVAKEVNRKDHTTVIHASRKITQMIESDSRFAEKIDVCRRGLSV